MAVGNGPYTIDVGTELTFSGGPSTPDTTYAWDFGDGVTASGQSATHTYADVGVYVAKFSTTVTAPGGVTTREFARVTVVDVAPSVVVPGPITVKEGQQFNITATFTQYAWPEHHTANVEWGDDSPIVEGLVAETDAPPEAEGTVTATHAYCHAGTYVVVVAVIDEHGCTGRGSTTVTVTDVPPRVHVEPLLFTYPCTPLDLVARFTFPGWCETHRAEWDFGDCTPWQPATVRERHQPPESTGVAIATHTYEHCGTFLARCVVTDDSGGVGEATTVVQMTDVENRDFEDGFHVRSEGQVANGWTEYVCANVDLRGEVVLGGETGPGTGPAAFAGDLMILKHGRRSQSISGAGPFQGGIFQNIGTNHGWEYQITVWYLIDERAGSCRLGVDPTGGTDADASTVQWSVGQVTGAWTQLCNRVVADARHLTVFLEAASTSPSQMWFDEVHLEAWPCRSPQPAVPRAPTHRPRCVSWTAQRQPEAMGPTFQQDGFTFSNPGGQTLEVVTMGNPVGEGKLMLPGRELHIAFPAAATRVVATVVALEQGNVVLEGTGSAGTVTAHANVARTPVPLEVSGTGLSSAVIVSPGKGFFLIELCIDESGKQTDVGINQAGRPQSAAQPAGEP